MISRLLSEIVFKNLFKNKTIVILGPRQVGKTTLVQSILASADLPSIYLNADLPSVREQLMNVGTDQLKQIIGEAKLVVIDEAQRIKNIGLTLKIIHDTLPHIQTIATGSSAFELSDEINEPMTGRKFEYLLLAISYKELIQHTNYLNALGQLDNRLIYGFYPDVLNTPGNEKQILNELSGSYLYKDILAFKGIRRPEILDKLLRAIAFQIGNEVSLNELSRLLEIDKVTVENYIQLLEQAFIIFRLNPFSRNLRNEINSTKKIYFYDNGIRNAIIENFSPLTLRSDVGALWENFLMSERKKYQAYSSWYGRSYFWRTYQQQEIDYLEEYDGQIYAYEFKWNSKSKAIIPKGFINTYPNAKTKVITKENFIEFLD